MTPDELREARKALGLSAASMGEMLGYGSPVRVYELETGKRRPSASVVRLLRAYLNGYKPDDWPSENPPP